MCDRACIVCLALFDSILEKLLQRRRETAEERTQMTKEDDLAEEVRVHDRVRPCSACSRCSSHLHSLLPSFAARLSRARAHEAIHRVYDLVNSVW